MKGLLLFALGMLVGGVVGARSRAALAARSRRGGPWLVDEREPQRWIN